MAFTFVIPLTCMVLHGGISTVLVSFTVPFTLSREKVLLDLSSTQAISTVNNDAILLHFHFVLSCDISFSLIKSRTLSMCNVPSCIGTCCAYALSLITSISTSSLNDLISGILRLTSTYPIWGISPLPVVLNFSILSSWCIFNPNCLTNSIVVEDICPHTSTRTKHCTLSIKIYASFSLSTIHPIGSGL